MWSAYSPLIIALLDIEYDFLLVLHYHFFCSLLSQPGEITDNHDDKTDSTEPVIEGVEGVGDVPEVPHSSGPCLRYLNTDTDNIQACSVTPASMIRSVVSMVSRDWKATAPTTV